MTKNLNLWNGGSRTVGYKIQANKPIWWSETPTTKWSDGAKGLLGANVIAVVRLAYDYYGLRHPDINVDALEAGNNIPEDVVNVPGERDNVSEDVDNVIEDVDNVREDVNMPVEGVNVSVEGGNVSEDVGNVLEEPNIPVNGNNLSGAGDNALEDVGNVSEERVCGTASVDNGNFDPEWFNESFFEPDDDDVMADDSSSDDDHDIPNIATGDDHSEQPEGNRTQYDILTERQSGREGVALRRNIRN